VRHSRIWLVVAAAAGFISTLLAAGVLWLILVHPVAAAALIGGGR
jgi:hypothetical protein